MSFSLKTFCGSGVWEDEVMNKIPFSNINERNDRLTTAG
ncbi:hypothetical protein SynBIOSU31_00904 [Synechococcus sp. BIOS-U3-1]|nr:hypothetical protein SynBIOSU31_00904 [Synechococcus sp. BIOS-U3-1]